MEIIELREKLNANGFEIKYYAERNFAVRFKSGHELSVTFGTLSNCSARFCSTLYMALGCTNAEMAGFTPNGAYMRLPKSRYGVVDSVDCEAIYAKAVSWAKRYGK